MSVIKAEERLFLNLLSAAIHNQPSESSLFEGLSDGQWRTIERIALRQSVPALIADRILALPREALPQDREFRLRLALQIDLVERANKRINRTLQEIRAEYEAEDLPFVLLKGQTLAYYYPQPLLRSSGDLDLYLYRPGDYERANQWAVAQGYRLQGHSLYEQLYHRGKVAIENHRVPAYFGQKRYDKAFAKMLRPLIEQDDFALLELEGLTYRTLPLELNAVYVFQHILHHFCYLGIGFRQICDWIVLLTDHQDELDVDQFQMLAEQLDLLRPMRLFALMAVRYLGVRPEIFPFDLPQDEDSIHLSDLIIQDIFRGGNFGMEAFAGKKFANIWFRRWFMFRKTFARSLRIGAVAPEHIRRTPLVAISNRIKLLFAKRPK
ncbi:MAG: nucleotidyltransferase family protein [Porphyromonadaceae bacterium]|nr:nucleotidyltransferase family protein [Porphyromonadaceae bacterium]